MAAALRSSSTAPVRRALRISQAALSTLPSPSRPATVVPFSRSVAAISGASNAFSWNFRRLLSSKNKKRRLPNSDEKRLLAKSDSEIETVLKDLKAIDLRSSNPPAISDPEIETALKDLMAASWNELPRSLVEEAKKAVSKATNDVAGQEALKNVFRAAAACEEFGGVLTDLRMALDDLCGLTGVIVGPLPGYVEDAVMSTYDRYMRYLESFHPDEYYLQKKVETELRTKMIHLKMRCTGIRSEWLMLFLNREFLRPRALGKSADKSRDRTSTD
ncbi:succinate dehydrogenase subunit 5, mitochondrial [Lolium perenne]|uniref:succinate dehydrogenase subunit 5, mitochondrial n=1 Tax=Lolium perenne TaxID=4522 RepID=UPI0021F6328E|nr:succinate dehydrogenase subunit 5, mitochondrial-like [Lolium perenne]